MVEQNRNTRKGLLTRITTLDALKATLRRIEGSARREAGVWPIGLPGLEAALPGGGLARGALHEIVAASGDEVAAEGFAATLLAGLAGNGLVLWCVEEGGLYGPGLARLGLSPRQVIVVRASRPADLLWAMEEGLRTPGLVAVLGEPRQLDLTASRRLQLAAEGSGVTGLVLSRAASAGATVAVTRWQVASAPSGPPLHEDRRDFGMARARWMVELTRCRGATPPPGEDGFGRWLVEEGDATAGALPVSVPMADRSAASAPIRRAV
jgi:protein ImuA